MSIDEFVDMVCESTHDPEHQKMLSSESSMAVAVCAMVSNAIAKKHISNDSITTRSQPKQGTELVRRPSQVQTPYTSSPCGSEDKCVCSCIVQ